MRNRDKDTTFFRNMQTKVNFLLKNYISDKKMSDAL